MRPPPATPTTPPDDTPDPAAAHPVLTLADAKRLETTLFAADETREWPAIQRAARALADAILLDYHELDPAGLPPDARILVLAGKGHNAADALLAAKHILDQHPRARADVCFAFGARPLRPLAMRAWRELTQAAPHNVAQSGSAKILLGGRREAPPKPPSRNLALPDTYALCLDGIFGFQFRPPLDKCIAALIARVNAHPIRLRAAVDLPSGLGDKTTFRADFTYATGSVKLPVLDNEHCGRLRYLDLGFFEEHGQDAHATSILTPAILDPLRTLRPSHTDKRDYGHLFIVGGSRSYPGAVLMSVLAALRSGAGLVTAFVPETLVPAFAARAPEAIWHGLAETSDGGLALENISVFRERFAEKTNSTARPTALLLGPGLSRERETLALAADLARMTPADIPLVIDADALQPDIVSAGTAPRILTPHAGEHARIAAAIPKNTVVVRKAPLTRIERTNTSTTYISPFGGPVLARGGSGDLLAGIIATQLAQTPQTPLLAACRGTAWHGMAADCLARTHGQHAVRTTDLLDYLSEALRFE